MSNPPGELPVVLPNHWTTASGREMAVEYAAKGRAEIGMRDVSDFALANDLYLAHGEIGIQTAAKERMRWLSVQLALRDAEIAAHSGQVDGLVEALRELMPTNVDLANPHCPDDTMLPCDITLGELRKAAAAIAKATGAQG